MVVSHSRALARAAVGLAVEMLQGQHVPIEIAAGLDEDTLGTDAVQIHAALVRADEGSGVVVLMDLGSALLSAELALELLEDDEARQRVLLSPAPLVEGLVVAAVSALSGAGRAAVAAEAAGALAAKQSQLHQEPASAPAPAPASGRDSPAPPAPASDPVELSRSGRFTVTPEHGLHARPAARLVHALHGLEATVELRNLSTGSDWVPGASLSRLATLGVARGHQVEIRAGGPQAGEAIEALLALAGRNFDDPSGPVPATPGPVPSRSGPMPSSPGIGIGPARLDGADGRPPGRPKLRVVRSERGDEEEGHRLDEAIGEVRLQLSALRDQLATEVGEAEAEIFDAHLALLEDPELLGTARARIAAGQSAEEAWEAAVNTAAAGFEALAQEYLRARAADVRAVGEQVSSHLLGLGEDVVGSVAAPPDRPGQEGGPDGGPRAGSVIVAADLTPARVATLNPERVAALVLAFGSPSAHSAILARARGIPAVVGAGPEVLQIAEGTLLAVDGTAGDFVIDPGQEVLADFHARALAAAQRASEALSEAGRPAVTRDGVTVRVGANIGSLQDARAAAASGADLAGLVRTEFLFLGRSAAPDVEEQEAAYRGLADALGGRRLTLRTLDVGGDKPLAYLPQPTEANPFLGVRGIRLALRRPELLAEQLLAIVRTAADVPVSLMFPMVSTVQELFDAREMLLAAIRRSGRPEPAGLQVGIMVEIPATALKAVAFAAHVDFFSIGTNDLTQYALAAERGNPAVAALGDALDPGVLALIDATCRGAAGRAQVSVCGELAADERAAGLLIGLGVRELSVNPRAVPGVKAALRAVSLAESRPLAAQALSATTAAEVRALTGPRRGAG